MNEQAKERQVAWQTATGGSEPKVHLVVERVLFPGCVKKSHSLVGQVYFTNFGIFVLGLAEIDLSLIHPSVNASAIVGLMGGGLLASWNAGNQQQEKARQALKTMETDYGRGIQRMTEMSLSRRFQEAERDVYHFSFPEIDEIVIPDMAQAAIEVHTSFGTLTLQPQYLTETLRQQLQFWAEGFRAAKAASPVRSAWTRQKAILFVRNHDAMEEGLRAYLRQAAQEPKPAAELCRALASGVDNERYWKLVARMAAASTPHPCAFAAAAAAHKSRTVFWSLLTGLFWVVAGLLLLALMIVTGAAQRQSTTSGGNHSHTPVGGLLIMMGIGALLVLVGLCNIGTGIGDYRRSRPYLRSRNSMSTA